MTNNNSYCPNTFKTFVLFFLVFFKLTGVIDWSWIFILTPLWFSLALELTKIIGNKLIELVYCLVDKN